ncbi:MAG: hypothetical protein ABFS32_22785 [Bacteroidota bacterium]
MNRLRKYAMLVVSIALLSCSNNVHKKNASQELVTNVMLKGLNERYDSIRLYFKPELLFHFPEKLDTSVISLTDNVMNPKDLARMELTCKIADDQVSEYIHEFEEIGIALYAAGDSCVLIPRRYITQERIMKPKNQNYIDSLSRYNFLPCVQSKYPIPNFWLNTYSDETTFSRLPKDFKIVVLQSESGKFYNEAILQVDSHMPNKWENGYSNGVAISEKEGVVIYWLIVW